MGSDLIIIDAGPLVAMLNSRDQYHRWAIHVVKQLGNHLYTTEAVLSETFFLLDGNPKGIESLLGLLERGSISVLSVCVEHIEEIVKLMRCYADQPMSLADATLVRISEIHSNVRIFTIDKHFNVYRRNGRQIIPLISPWTPADN